MRRTRMLPARWGLKAMTVTQTSRQSSIAALSPLEAPVNKEWGVRTAYFRGPGALKCEIEGPLVNK